MSWIKRHSGPAVLAFCAVLVMIQVLVRPAVGIANNNDFAKMSGALGLGPEDGDWLSHKQYEEFVYRYIRADRYFNNQNFRTAQYLSSEFFFVKLARGMQRILHPGPRFDIRWLGGVTASFFLLAIGIWLYAFPLSWRLYGGAMLVLVWTDVAYVQYLNSFYMDTAAMIFLMLAVAAGLHAVKDRSNRVFPVLMTSAAILFAVSKSQHSLPALLFVPLFVGLALWSRGRVARAAWAAGSVVLVIGSFFVIGRNTDEYRSIPVFNMVFLRIAPGTTDPARTLQALGLGGEELPLLHTYAYLSDSPMQDTEWARQFRARCNYATLLRYYFRHPSVAAHFLHEDLSGAAADIRPFANRSLDDGFPPGTQATRFTYWTNLRAFLLKHAPWHLILIAAVNLAGALWLVWRRAGERAFAGLVLLIQFLAAAEYGLSVLGDGAETERHLMIFHVATETSLLLLPLLIQSIAAVPGPAQAAVQPQRLQ